MSNDALTHAALVERGARWLKRQGFQVVSSELRCVGTSEEPDLIGFRSMASVVIEVKCSRSDFLADRHKRHRAQGLGMGLYRFMLCPSGLIAREELPPRWGLLYASGRSIEEVLRPLGNIWPAKGTTLGDWAEFQHDFDAQAERHALFSIARRALG